MDEEISLRPTYRFEWSDGIVRETSDPDAYVSEESLDPDVNVPNALENLAAFGREDPNCEVTLLGLDNKM